MKVPEPRPPRNCMTRKAVEVRGQRAEQARHEEDDDAHQQHAADAENSAEIGRGDADEHLPDAEARRDPSGFVEADVQAAAQIGEAEGCRAAAERAHRRAEQDADEADIGARRYFMYLLQCLRRATGGSALAAGTVTAAAFICRGPTECAAYPTSVSPLFRRRARRCRWSLRPTFRA